MGTKTLYVIILGCCMVVAVAREHKHRLIIDLMTDYNKLLKPEGVNGTALRVEHFMNINRIVSLENGVLTTDAWLTLKWIDTQLQWDPEEYGNVTSITLPSKVLWQPDILLYNNAAAFNGLHSGDINMVITHDGTVFYVPPVKIMSYCNINDNLFGVTTCTMKFASWTHDGFNIDLQFQIEDGDNTLSDFDDSFNKDWKLESVSLKRNVVYYACCPQPYVDIVYTLKLKKRIMSN